MKKLNVPKVELGIKSKAVKLIGELYGAKPSEVLCVARTGWRANDGTNRFEYNVVLKNGEVL